MKTNAVSLLVLGTLVLATLLVIGIVEIQHAYAQVDATSSGAVATSSTDTTPATDATTSTSTETVAIETITAATDSTTTTSDSVAPTEPPPQGLSEVHIIGTKYTDYFTDGSTITSYPGDPIIDSNLDKPDAPIPTHEGLTWDHTDGHQLYDTPSGDLDVGDYALQSNGTYITNAPPVTSSTSTPEVLGASTSASGTSPDTSSTSTVVDPTDTNAPPTTSEATTTPPVTNVSASDANLPPATTTTTDTTSI